MRSLRPLSLAVGLLLLGGVFGPLAATLPARAASTTIEITDVYNPVAQADEWFQLYNMSKGSLTLTGWSVCTSTTCVSLPTTTIESFSLAKFKASALTGWPAKGMDGANEMLGIKDQAGKPVDALNWGIPVTTWKNYEAFKDMLWNPGIKAPDPNANQSFFRMALASDNDKPTDWLSNVKGQTGGPAATATPAAAPTSGPLTNTVIPPKTVTKNPTTGGEFPFLLALGLLGALAGIRYFRRGTTPSRNS